MEFISMVFNKVKKSLFAMWLGGSVSHFGIQIETVDFFIIVVPTILLVNVINEKAD